MFAAAALFALLSISAHASPADLSSDALSQPKIDSIMSSYNETLATRDLEARDGQCNTKGCVGAILGAIGASAGCAATGAAAEFDAPAAAVVCAGAVPAAIVNTIIQCQGCQVIGACPAGDNDATSNACDWRGGQTRLGPNQCLQHKAGVPKPSNTDVEIDGNLVVHCHNSATVEQGGDAPAGTLCHMPCSSCQQCAGHASKRGEEFSALDAVAVNL